MKAQDRPVRDWMMKIRNGEIALPRFQRKESWGNTTRQDFLTSVVRDLPVGVALILQSREEPHFKPRYLSGAPKGGDNLTEQLLDGQQRLTTLWKAFTDAYNDRTYLLSLEDEDSLEVIGKKRYTKDENDKRYPLWVDAAEKCWERKMVPLHIMNPDQDTSKRLRKWCKEATDSNEAADDLFDILLKHESQISRFNIPYLYLPPHTEPDVAIDVFIKLNTSFVDLSTYDIIVAQTEEAAGESLHRKMEELQDTCPRLGEYTDPERYVLRVAALLQDKLPSNKGFFDLDLQKMVAEWDTLVTGTEKMIRFLEQEHIFDGERLPTDIILAPIAALSIQIPSDSDVRGNGRRILKKYMWRSFFTERYDRATNTRTHEDYRILCDLIVNGDSEKEAPIFDDNAYPVVQKQELEKTRWPKRKDRIARGLLLISFKSGARNIADDEKISKRNIDEREYHHLYPRAYLVDKGYDEAEANNALNCALINWKDNRKIGSKPPLEYLVERAEADNLGEDQIRRRLESHLIDFDDLAKEDYEVFLKSRAKTMHKIITNLCQGKDYNAHENRAQIQLDQDSESKLTQF